MCSPCGPMVCYKYEDCGPPTRSTEGTSRTEDGGARKKQGKENELKRVKSRELRGSIMYYSCHCIKRNGLQHECRRTGCGGEPACLVLPDPMCGPSQLARHQRIADPAPLAAHLQAQSGGGTGRAADPGSSSGKRFIVCELKSISPDIPASPNKGGKCCKCPTSLPVSKPALDSTKTESSGACICLDVLNAKPVPVNNVEMRCSCKCDAEKSGKDATHMFVFDEETIEKIVSSLNSPEVGTKDMFKPGDRARKVRNTVRKEDPCTRPGCLHWKPPPPCLWDAPCKADCFEAHPGITPGRNPLTGGGGTAKFRTLNQGASGSQPRENMKLLTPKYCSGCCKADGGSSAAVSGGPAPGLPVLVMKLC